MKYFKSIIDLFEHMKAVTNDLKEQASTKIRKNKIELERGSVLDPNNHTSKDK